MGTTDEFMANKIFTTFTKKEQLQETLDKIISSYTILYKKIFIFSSSETEELICTYNVDQNNTTDLRVIENTVLLHRNKEHNVLFSINTLNILNEPNIDWAKYQKSILLTRKGEFTIIPTILHDIIYL
jgi:hypothetical protein